MGKRWFYVNDFSRWGQVTGGGVQADTPKKAVREYLLEYHCDKETIKYVKKIGHIPGADFVVHDTARNKKYPYIIM